MKVIYDKNTGRVYASLISDEVIEPVCGGR